VRSLSPRGAPPVATEGLRKLIKAARLDMDCNSEQFSMTRIASRRSALRATPARSPVACSGLCPRVALRPRCQIPPTKFGGMVLSSPGNDWRPEIGPSPHLKASKMQSRSNICRMSQASTSRRPRCRCVPGAPCNRHGRAAVGLAPFKTPVAPPPGVQYLYSVSLFHCWCVQALLCAFGSWGLWPFQMPL
jgi:hypothetical protein